MRLIVWGGVVCLAAAWLMAQIDPRGEDAEFLVKLGLTLASMGLISLADIDRFYGTREERRARPIEPGPGVGSTAACPPSSPRT